ncbi:adenylate/guanylate cyclase domain-containing protein [Ruegeria sp. 2205SS24-7]|uniref:adenylate/guanylate cyclase domain-containing protein n=1 Tax=Ruegeria discodermiae TaxID=3064389 RepID=UPI00274278E7|nr:adenylate/guanylate cyclase domain-containing protein [Ruegeria sp. 2205SS24-7]MDP5218382.1 adenylate/guanylate cyclase domain-containing protein [Ruegeria sp. 2205SS24-7]
MTDRSTQSRGKGSAARARTGMSPGAAATIAAFASLLTCYVGVALEAFFGIKGMALNPHLQAVLMWMLAFVATAFVFRDRERHGSALPLLIAGLANIVLLATLYFHYDHRFEALAYVLLIIATLMNQNLLLQVLNRKVRSQTVEISELNAQLANKVERQAGQIGRLERLKEFLAPQIAQAVVDGGRENLLSTHRRYIACLFCDIRNFTALSEALDPEDVIDILQRYHDRCGALAAASGGTIGFRSGDGLMIYFNDPIPCEAPVLDAVKLALDIRREFAEICAPWRRMGHVLGIGLGISSGHATMGLVGREGRADYTAVGGVVNVASRLCDAAAQDEILISQRAFMDVEDHLSADPVGGLKLKGFANPVEAYRVLSTNDPVAN